MCVCIYIYIYIKIYIYKRIRAFKDFDNSYRQNYVLHDILTVYNVPELGNEFVDAKEDVKQLLKMMGNVVGNTML